MSGPFPTTIPPFPGLRYLGSAPIASFASVQPLPTPPDGATIAILSIEGGNVRWGIDGDDPTDSVGAPIWGTSFATISKSMFSSIRFINMTGTTSTGTVDWYG